MIGSAKKSGPDYRFGIDGAYNFSRQSPNGGGPLEVATDFWTFGGRYERDFGRKSFWYASARFDRDGVNNLNLRQNYGAGLGYTLFDEADWSWRVSAGASQVFEDYTTSNDSYLGLQAESEYTRQLMQKLSLVHRFTYVPNASEFSDYFFVSNLGLNYEVAQNFNVGFSWIVNFDSTPAVGSVKQVRTYAFTLGYKF